MVGSGKTTVAPLVAARLGRPWHDTDEEIAAVAGIGVAELVANDRARFRQLERVQVTRLAGSGSGGGRGGGGAGGRDRPSRSGPYRRCGRRGTVGFGAERRPNRSARW